jgi:purine catabolism regulator
MAPTVRGLCADPALRLDVLTGTDHLDRPIRWVHATELADPRAYLEGGELLLTTGMRLGKAAPALRTYVDRLAQAGVVALAFGTGADLTHREVPTALVSACETAGMPLIEVPENTPFIQVTKAVSDLIAAQEREHLARSLDAQRALARASLHEDRDGALVRRLAREIGGWVLLLGPRGEVLDAAPSTAHAHAPSIRPEIERLRPKGLHAGSSSSSAGQRVVIQPVGVGAAPGATSTGPDHDQPRAYLVAAAPEPWSVATTSVVHTAVSLLSSAARDHAGHDDAIRQLRAAALALAMAGHADSLPLTALGWSGLASGAISVYACVGDAGVMDDVEKRWSAAVATGAVAAHDGAVIAVVSAHGLDEDAITAVCDAPGTVSGLRIGRSDATSLDDLGSAVRRARQAAAAPAADGGGVSEYADLAGVGLLDLIDATAGQGFSDAVLAPIADAPGGDDLLVSLDAWLAHHGQWDAAAKVLGIHRHTLRHRVRRIEQLMGRSVDDPAVRVELWFALRLRDDTP